MSLKRRCIQQLDYSMVMPEPQEPAENCNKIKTPQHDCFKITCLEMGLRTSGTDQGRI
jgi:hypothetical protein